MMQHQKIEGFSRMRVSIERNKIKYCNAQKTVSGSYFTRSSAWLLGPVVEFARRFTFETVLDPFAGAGDMLDAFGDIFAVRKEGLDLYDKRWAPNDSLLSIPVPEKCFIVTNPPYLAKSSATRKGVLKDVSHYFDSSGVEDLYQLALIRLSQARCPYIAVVPETFLTSGMQLTGLERIVLLEENPFEDTETPVCVVCCDPEYQGRISVFRGETFLGDRAQLMSARISPSMSVQINFNDARGEIGLRAVDLTSPKDRIAFMPASELAYNRERVKVSSRLITFIHIEESVPLPIENICNRANAILEKIRADSCDIVLSAFKGNNRAGTRRRRLDYALARAILELAVAQFVPHRRLVQEELSL